MNKKKNTKKTTNNNETQNQNLSIVIGVLLLIVLVESLWIVCDNKRGLVTYEEYMSDPGLHMYLEIFSKNDEEKDISKKITSNDYELIAFNENLYLKANNEYFTNNYEEYIIGNNESNIDDVTIKTNVYTKAYKLEIENVKTIDLCKKDSKNIAFAIEQTDGKTTYLLEEDLNNQIIKFNDSVECSID